MIRSYNDFITKRRVEFGNKFDASNLAPQFIPYFENQNRIEVQFPYGVERGRIGVTTGWKPVFLLIKRRSDRSSSTTLRENDVVLRVIAK